MFLSVVFLGNSIFAMDHRSLDRFDKSFKKLLIVEQLVETRRERVLREIISSFALMPPAAALIIAQYYEGNCIAFYNKSINHDYTQRFGIWLNKHILLFGLHRSELTVYRCCFSRDMPHVLQDPCWPISWNAKLIQDDLKGMWQIFESNVQLSSKSDWNRSKCACGGTSAIGRTPCDTLNMLMDCDVSAESSDSEAVSIGRENSLLYMVNDMNDANLLEGIAMWFARGSKLSSKPCDGMKTFLEYYPRREAAITRMIGSNGKLRPVFRPVGRKIEKCMREVVTGWTPIGS